MILRLLRHASPVLLRPATLLAPVMLALLSATARAEEHAPGGVGMGAAMPLWTLIPFVAILLAIAVLPLFAGHWWEHNSNKGIIAALCGVPVAAYMLVSHGSAGGHVLLEKLHEYVSFICLLGSLFIITGGIYIRGSLSGTPLLNTAILGIGAVIASFIGTTGASVLLIRPLLRANAPRAAGSRHRSRSRASGRSARRRRTPTTRRESTPRPARASGSRSRRTTRPT